MTPRQIKSFKDANQSENGQISVLYLAIGIQALN